MIFCSSVIVLINKKEYCKKNPTLFIPEKEIMALVTDFVEILVHGLKPATR